ncbi:endonuclease/exonuclease/phosphatase family metal-dependent hydrolase [Sphingobium fontiphilum]|uniref:Endonuclease/exonuclease/phosphatase family metal-dependent hydrolase n=1 Tax=Sphingobium fontiphilum TaxID=944425 RepID=A0A7W6DD40_9SPHN|nr:endonuclease/exonuclease/phosphatase family protein [Sphingobium fontiphilum]MBB3980379.1 endonuclease/exonuclease/phosphatase family metal-dependent hydrolase [Sphingobium fontiphilum]
MAKLLSVLSWNVEHFGASARGKSFETERIGRVVDLLAQYDPDIFGLFEVEGKDIFETLVTRMPGYTFQITEGPQTQEILVGIRRNITAFVTQKVEYRSGTTHMRPGQLVTARVGGHDYAILFLHVASGVDPRGMGLRDDMVQRAFDFRKVLDKSAGGRGQARYIILGDLNSMGLEYPFDHGIPHEIELKKWDKEAARAAVQMVRQVKSWPYSWSNGSRSRIPDSSLDHVYVSQQLTLKHVPGADGGDATVHVGGWAQAPDDAAKDQWIADYSDHCPLYFELVE